MISRRKLWKQPNLRLIWHTLRILWIQHSNSFSSSLVKTSAGRPKFKLWSVSCLSCPQEPSSHQHTSLISVQQTRLSENYSSKSGFKDSSSPLTTSEISCQVNLKCSPGRRKVYQPTPWVWRTPSWLWTHSVHASWSILQLKRVSGLRPRWEKPTIMWRCSITKTPNLTQPWSYRLDSARCWSFKRSMELNRCWFPSCVRT